MLKAGFARLDITPPLGAPLAGYFYDRFAKGVLDPLYLNAVAVSNDTDTVIFISVDYLGIGLRYLNEYRKHISERTGVPEDHILIASLHQHTSCCLVENRVRAIADKTYLDVLYRKFGDVAKMAVDDLKATTVGTAALETEEPIAFVRRYFTADGGVATNPRSDIKITSRCAEADNTMRLVRFHREGAKDIAIVNFSTHPDVVTGEYISADWPGFTRYFVEADNPDVSCLFFTGCQGDSNHFDFFKPKDQRLRGTTYEHSRYMGRTVADAVKKVWDHTQPQTGEAIFGKHQVIYNLTNTQDVDKYDQYKAWYSDYEAGKLDYQPHITELAYASRIIKLRTAPIFRPVPLTVIGFGDVLFVGFGGEAFTAYGQLARELAPDKFVVCAVCANGYEGYFPTQEAFAQGGYETSGSLFTPTLEQEIAAGLKDLLGQA